ncbi:uncharacterized protein LOC143194125 [Rhynchophorus ferrugineus]|uniref:Ig-like domain-containing protein n=1 Tax=Rhynchophorus ferrugineus TaxID=354439 RepID=A0A834IPK9_RHYFE|nr:hypothetical protein GWI33_023373 [Rhynchophorus ferrugineus]
MGINPLMWKWFLFLSFGFKGVFPLRNVQVTIPKAVKVYDTVTLLCKYDLEGEQLYSVKWYKGNKEFFRYIPKEMPSMLVFPIPGINVDLSKSNANEVVLRDVQREVTGLYRCEVSTDMPNFYTMIVSSYMYVVDIPSENPILHIQREFVEGNYLVRANCSAPPSFPAMNITWYINGLKVNENGRKIINLSPIQTFPMDKRRLRMTVSYVSKEINENVFQGGVIKVQCVSTLFHLYKSEDVRYIDDDRPKPWPSSVIGFNGISAGSSFFVQYICWIVIIGVFMLR